jgi:hypothetical protein
METPKTPNRNPPQTIPDTVPPKLVIKDGDNIIKYNDLIKIIGTNYTPTNNYTKKSGKSSGIYFESTKRKKIFRISSKKGKTQKFIDHISFHYTKEGDEDEIIRGRIHYIFYYENLEEEKQKIKNKKIEFKTTFDGGVFKIIPHDDFNKLYQKEIVINDKCKDVIAEIKLIEKFVNEYLKGKEVFPEGIDESSQPPPSKYGDAPLPILDLTLSNYKKYKLKYLILKKYYNNN